MRYVRLLLIIAAALVLSGSQGQLGVSRLPGPAEASTETTFARIQAVAFDGSGTVGNPVTEQASDFQNFNQSVSADDDLSDGRAAHAQAQQETHVDVADLSAASIDTDGSATATWVDGEPGDDKAPQAAGRSEFNITFTLPEGGVQFSLIGTIQGTSSATNGDCGVVDVVAPNGTTFHSGAPAGNNCGPGGAVAIDESGELSAGPHTFSVLAIASVENADVGGGNASATFGLSLRIGCSTAAGPASTDDDNDGDNLANDLEESIGTDPDCKDTDGDGLLDPWEVDPGFDGAGFDFDEDGTPDVGRDEVFGPYHGQCGPETFGLRREPDGQNCSLVSAPDPLHKDVYVEMDWQDCALGSCPESVLILGGAPIDPSHHSPSITGLADVVGVFDGAPVANPDGTSGINLNILVDEAIAHDHNCDQGAAETRPTNFGTVQQRANAQVIAAKEMVFRYAWSGHSSLKATPQECPLPSVASVLLAGVGLTNLPEYDISPHGHATPGGRDILVTLAVTWVCQLYTFDLGQGHFAPCFRTLAPTTGIAPGLFPAEIPGIGGAIVPWQKPIHTMLGVPASQGVRQVWGRAFMNLLGQSLGVPSGQVGNNPNATGQQTPDSYGSWDGLAYAPPAPGGSPSALGPASSGDGFVAIFPDATLAEQDHDGDGTPEGTDNCPGLSNANQGDLDGDGVGDACDGDEDGDGLVADDDDDPGDTDNDGTENSIDNDDDGDGVNDVGDNCPLVPNPGEANADGDGEGDVCDPDADGDGLPNSLETTMGSDPLSEDEGPEFLGYENTCGDGLDNDADGATDGADGGCQDDDGDTAPDSLDNCPGLVTINLLDSDGDGHGDLCEPAGTDRTWGDVKCDGNVNLGDSIALARTLVSLDPGQSAGCPGLGGAVTVGSAERTWGDVDCSGALGLGDAIAIARFLVGIVPNLAGCPVLGTTVTVET